MACKRAPALAPRTDATARGVRMATENQKLLSRDGVGALLQVLRNRFAPDAMGARFPDYSEPVAKFDFLRPGEDTP